MPKNKQKKGFHWDWKIFFIIILALLFVYTLYELGTLKQDYDSYKQEAKDYIHELELNSVSSSAEMDCYERGIVDCYPKGQVTQTDNELTEFLINHDCYESGTVQCYDSSAYCYEDPCVC